MFNYIAFLFTILSYIAKHEEKPRFNVGLVYHAEVHALFIALLLVDLQSKLSLLYC